jgi:hypothetical protein
MKIFKQPVSVERSFRDKMQQLKDIKEALEGDTTLLEVYCIVINQDNLPDIDVTVMNGPKIAKHEDMYQHFIRYIDEQICATELEAKQKGIFGDDLQ